MRPNFNTLRNLVKTCITDTAEMAKIVYIGPKPSFGVNVDGVTMANWDPAVTFTGHDVTFSLDVGTTLDTSIGTAGVISNDAGAANFTFGALAALVNASANWRMILVGALASDLVYLQAGAVDQIMDIAAGANARACTGDEGTVLLLDTTAGLIDSVCIGPEATGAAEGHIMGRISEGTIKHTPRDVTKLGDVRVSAQRWWSFLRTLTGNGTFAAGAAALQIYEATQTDSTLLFSRVGAATTVDQITDKDEWGEELLFATPGKRLIVRYIAGTNGTAVAISAAGGVGFESPGV